MPSRSGDGVWTVEVLRARGLLPDMGHEPVVSPVVVATKHGNEPNWFDGYFFDSKAEIRRYRHLRIREKAGDICNLRMHKDAVLIFDEGFRDVTGYKWRDATYEPDFRYNDHDGSEVVEDVKGEQTAVFRLKMRLVIKRYPGIRFDVLPAGQIDADGNFGGDASIRASNKKGKV